MKVLSPKDFIQAVLIEELKIMMENHPYISFIVMGIGIEFLGKCIDSQLTDWNMPNRSRFDFENAIKSIPKLQEYECYLATHDLYSSFRCGLAHAVSPKFKITLSSKNELAHRVEHNGRLNLKVEDFYKDFKEACEFVINKEYEAGDKMNGDFLEVPEDNSNAGMYMVTGTTINYLPPSGDS